MRALYPVLPFALALLIAGEVRAEGVTVALDHAERLNLRGSAANVMVGNSAVADVTVLNSHTLYILGRAYGSTGILVTDAMGRSIYSGDVTVGLAPSAVAVYRGAGRSEYACAPTCSEAARAGAPAAPAGGGAAPPPPAHP